MQSEDIRKKLVLLIAEMKQMQEFDESLQLIESGLLDSFDLMRLATSISENFGVELAGEDIVLENFENVTALASAISTKMSR